jgi:hypothetical protein
VNTMPDRVLVKIGAGKPKELTVDQFLAIDLRKQVEMLFKGEVTFLKGDVVLRAVDALRTLRENKAVPQA